MVDNEVNNTWADIAPEVLSIIMTSAHYVWNRTEKEFNQLFSLFYLLLGYERVQCNGFPVDLLTKAQVKLIEGHSWDKFFEFSSAGDSVRLTDTGRLTLAAASIGEKGSGSTDNPFPLKWVRVR
jgi:hypothetical protein